MGFKYLNMKKGFLIRNGFLLVAGVSGGLLAKALGYSSDTAIIVAILALIVSILGMQSPKSVTD